MATSGTCPLVEKLLECHICLEEMRDPRVLPCSHSFCKTCLEKHINSSKEKPLRCPTCRKDFTVPEKGIDNIPRSFVLNTLKDSLKVSKEGCVESGPDSVKVKDCVNTAPDQTHGAADKFCKECAEYYCEACAEGHGRYRATRGHKLLNAGDVSEEDALQAAALLDTPKCRKHPKEDVVMFCCTCKLDVCILCIIATHKEHEVLELNVAAEQFVSEMNAARSLADDFLKELVKEKELLGSTEKQIQTDAEKARGLVKEVCDNLHQLINNHQKTVNDQISSFENNANDAVNVAREERQNLINKFQEQCRLANNLTSIFDQVIQAPGVKSEFLAITKTTLMTKCVQWRLETSFQPLVKLPQNVVGVLETRATEIAKTDVKVSSFRTVNQEDTVTGMATSLAYLYVIQQDYPGVLMFTASGTQKAVITVPDLKEPVGLGVVATEDTTVVVGDQGKKLHYVGVSEDACSRVSHRNVNLNYTPSSISIDGTGTSAKVIVASQLERTVFVHDLTGALLSKVNMANAISSRGLKQIEKTKGGYFITDNREPDHCHVALVDDKGNILRRYKPSKHTNFWFSVQDSHRNVIVIDIDTNHVHFLLPDLRFQQYLLGSKDGVNHPRKICLNEDQGYLYISQGLGKKSCVLIYKYQSKFTSSPCLNLKLLLNKWQDTSV